jgi:hypothetical protein
MASFLHQHHAWRLSVLLVGTLFATSRRTVASWLRAAGVGLGFSAFYYLLAALGRCAALPAGLRRRGRPPAYGAARISLPRRAGQKRGWQLVQAR